MSQPARIADPVSAVFGDDKPSVTYDHIAQQVKSINARALTPSQFDDVIVLIEFMRDEAVKLHDRNVNASRELAAREVAVSKRERDVAIRGRAIDAALRTHHGIARIKHYFNR